MVSYKTIDYGKMESIISLEKPRKQLIGFWQVPGDVRHIRPMQGISWQAIKEELDGCDEGDCKLIFLARHGHAKHNELKERWSRPIFHASLSLLGACGTRDNLTQLTLKFYQKFISQNPQYADPDLTETGKMQAQHIGRAVRGELEANSVFPKLRSGSFYTSPLRRCITTAVAISNAAYWREHSDSTEPHIDVVDNFREWLGWNHNE